MADSMSATATIDAPPEVVFARLADPDTHAAIDGTGWVRGARGNRPITAAGQVFRMDMFHPDHPVGDYRTANLVEVFEPPSAISWRTGYDKDDGTLGFGGWFWRYDLAPTGTGATRVTLTYDWSQCADEVRERIGFPPFPVEHLARSLAHLGEIVAGARRTGLGPTREP